MKLFFNTIVLSAILIAQNSSLAQEPNFIFIICDDLAALDGQVMSQAYTPNLDMLMAQGINFNNAHSNAPLCAPSRASLFNGIQPFTSNYYAHQMSANDWYENPGFQNTTTIFEHLKENGYRVNTTGKLFHHGIHDTSMVSEYFDLKANHGPWPWNGIDSLNNGTLIESGHSSMPEELSDRYGGIAPLSDVPEFANYTGWTQDKMPFFYENDSVRDLMADEKATNYVCSFLEQDHPEPFFIGAGFYRPHTPYYVPKKYFDLYPIENIELPLDTPYDLNDVSSAMINNNSNGRSGMNLYNTCLELSADSTDVKWWLKRQIQGYLASVSFVDEQVGKIMDCLANSDYSENTYLVFTSDHGYHLGEKLRFQKNTLWTPSTAIPLIIKGPNVVENSIVSHPVSLIDLYPTILDVSNLPLPSQNLDGYSIKPFLENPTNGMWDGPDYSLFGVGAFDGTIPETAAIVRNQHHSILTNEYRFSLMSSGETELYDLSQDPYELINLTYDPQYEIEKSELLAELLNELGLSVSDMNMVDSLDALFYGNFEQDFNCWIQRIENGSIAEFSINEENPINESKNLKVDISELTEGFTNNVVLNNKCVSLKQNQLYRLSFKARTDNIGSALRLMITRNGIPNFGNIVEQSLVLNEELQEYQWFFTFPEETTSHNARFRIEFQDESIYELDDIKIRAVIDLGILSEEIINSINVFPNPTSENYVFIQSDYTWKYCELYNAKGQMIFRENFPTDSKVNLKNLDSGVYNLRLLNDDWSAVKKIIVK